MNKAPTILKKPKLALTEDYVELRKRGIDLIQQLGNALWTDYNIHDPGITLLELLCYAQTELGYRMGFSVPDLLAPPPGQVGQPDEQCFFTARRILTVNPWTTNDFRKLLIDQEGVRNAWLACKECSCDFTIYANCQKSILQYEKTEHPIRIKGFYDVLLELDSDPVSGDLNSGKVFNRFTFVSGGRLTSATAELRLPPWHRAAADIDKFSSFIKEKSFIEGITNVFVSGNKNQPPADLPDAAALYRALRNPLYVTMDVQFRAIAGAPLQTTTLRNIPLKIWYRSDADRQAITLAGLKTLLSDTSPAGILTRYLTQLKKADEVVRRATQVLHQHRNIAEDFCTVGTVAVEDVAVCADVDMSPDADIEAVLGRAYWLIDQYMNPSVRFYSLQQLIDNQTPTEDIFNGPPLDHGFIRNEDLDASGLRTKLFASDIINLLMDIPGITAVRNLTLARYNAEGKLVESQPWELAVSAGHQPRFYTHGSKVLVYKNGLPFLPDADELNDTLLQWRGRSQQNKMLQPVNDLPVPTGEYVDLASSYPLAYSLPETYGVGPHGASTPGLPDPVTPARRGQARQLQAYLLAFEHLLAVYVRQLAQFKDLLNTNPSITRTYFATVFAETDLRGVTDLYDNGAAEPVFQELLEDPAQFAARRNAFLDHLMGRFAESFSDYALMLYTAFGSKVKADEELIEDKIDFLTILPRISANRGKSFDYKDETKVCQNDNLSGLQERIRVLLGLNDPAADEWATKVLLVEHILLRPRNQPGPKIKDGDPLLPICIPPDCRLCGEEDPYSFRITIVLNGEEGLANGGILFRRFAEKTIRMEVPAHLGVKICWVSTDQLKTFSGLYCDWLAELSKSEPNALTLSQKLSLLLTEFSTLKSVYPKASLHDCVDGDDENRVFLNQTVI